MPTTTETYTPADQKFWHEKILPTLDEAIKANPQNTDLLTVATAIRNRLFLKIRDFSICVNGAVLRISPEETKESAQAKLFDFLDSLKESKKVQEDEGESQYTDADQEFWRGFVIPSLTDIKSKFENDPGFRLLNILIEKRLLTSTGQETGLDLDISGIKLDIKPGDKKAQIQKKLKNFLTQLKTKQDDGAIEKHISEASTELKGLLGSNWQKQQAGRQEVDNKGYRYTKADKLFWDHAIMPVIEELDGQFQNNGFQKLVEATRDRQFLITRTWDVSVDGVTLAIDASDNQDERQSKLGDFLNELYEKTYTSRDKTFWRQIILPSIHELEPLYGNDLDFKMIVSTIEERLYLDTRSIYIEIAGVILDVNRTDSKIEAQQKLKTFLDGLKQSSKIETITQQVKIRTQKLEEQLKRMKYELEKKEDALRIKEHQVRTAETTIRQSQQEIRQIRQEAADARSELQQMKSSYGSSSRRASYSYSSSGE